MTTNGDADAIDWNAFYAQRADAMLEELLDLVRIESPSRDAAAIRILATRLARDFAETGASVDLVDEHPHGPNLIARFGAGERPLLLVGHLDTVWPLGTLEAMPAEVRNGIAVGPGIYDMKAGCLVALEALRGLAHFGLRPPVVVLLTCDEEIGSTSSRPLIAAEAQRARLALVLEPPIPGGLAKTSRSGVARYRVRVHGRAAHAGLDPEKGVNAVVGLSLLVAQLHALNDLANGLSVNVGTMTGGTRTNVVPAEALAEVDVRFRTAEQMQHVDEAIRALRPTLPGASVDIDGRVDRPPFERTAETMQLYERAAEAAHGAGFELGHGHVGGASDGNLIAALGVPVLDGLGVDGQGAHATHEQIVVADLPRRAAMLARLMLGLAVAG